MPTGIVLSTQSPEKNNTEFPRRGGTGAGINQVTNYPVMKMHRDAKPRDNEIDAYKAIENGSIVFITGHSNTGLDNITGDYVPPPSSSQLIESSQPIEPISTEWTYQQFRDLLVDNGNLKPGDHITVVLWACNAGEGDLDSGAALMGRLFRDAGINTTIISSANPTLRFNGKYTKTADGDVMEFKTVNGSKDLRIFKFTQEKTVLWKNKTPIIATANGIEGYNLYDPQELEVLKSDQLNPALKEIFSDKRYRDDVNKDNLKKFLDSTDNDFFLRLSSLNTPNQGDFVIFSASTRVGNVIENRRYAINAKGEIYTSPDGKPERVELLPTGIVDSIQSHFSLALNQAPANVGEKEFRPENRGEKKHEHRHRDEKEHRHRHRGEKEHRHRHRGEKELEHGQRGEKEHRHRHRGDLKHEADPENKSMFVGDLNLPTSKTKHPLSSAQDSMPVAQRKAGNPNTSGGKRPDQNEPLDKLEGQKIRTRTHQKQMAQDMGPNPGKKGGFFAQPAEEKKPSSKTESPAPRTPRRN